MSPPADSEANFIHVDWASWSCAQCCWTVPPHARDEATCEVLIRLHIQEHQAQESLLKRLAIAEAEVQRLSQIQAQAQALVNGWSFTAGVIAKQLPDFANLERAMADAMQAILTPPSVPLGDPHA